MNRWILAGLALIYLSIVVVVAGFIGRAVTDNGAEGTMEAHGNDGTGSACVDPIDEKHRGLQWLDRAPLGQHLAIDFVSDEGDEVRAIADGEVWHYHPRLGYYGGCDGTAGPVLITRHRGGSHGWYSVQYGHVRSSLRRGDAVKAGQVLGEVIEYKPCCDTPAGCPHLHFAIWDSPSEQPSSGMGYGAPRSFVNPDWFFEKKLCAPSP